MSNDRPQMVTAQMEPALRMYKLFMNKTNEKYFNSFPTLAADSLPNIYPLPGIKMNGLSAKKQHTYATSNEVMHRQNEF